MCDSLGFNKINAILFDFKNITYCAAFLCCVEADNKILECNKCDAKKKKKLLEIKYLILNDGCFTILLIIESVWYSIKFTGINIKSLERSNYRLPQPNSTIIEELRAEWICFALYK